MRSMAFIKKWIIFSALGALLMLVARYTVTDAFLATAGLICYIALVGYIWHRTHLSFQKKLDQLYAESHEDQLTGVKNRRYLFERMQELMARHARSGEKFALVLFDLDNFKNCNDQFGHPAGDRVLQEAAKLLQRSTREQEPLARYGGDEFVLLLPGSGFQEAQETAKRLRQELEQSSFTINGQQLALQVSSGVAVCPDDGLEIEDLLNAADRNLYRDKRKYAFPAAEEKDHSETPCRPKEKNGLRRTRNRPGER